MKLEVGEIVTGKVTGIAKFGAFVELAPGKSGLVYISEISTNFVKEVSDYLTTGQEVTVKIIKIDDNGRINLSIKQAQVPAPVSRPAPAPVSTRPATPAEAELGEVDPPSANQEFEDRLKKFMRDSDSHLSDIRRQNERHTTRRRR